MNLIYLEKDVCICMFIIIFHVFSVYARAIVYNNKYILSIAVI